MSPFPVKIHAFSYWTWVLLSIPAASLLAAPNLGQAAEQIIEEVEVLGIRRSLLDSMNTKRFADSVVDAISAEDIGKFPDKNIAESLSRITGLAVSRDFGEGEKISIRGTASNQNRTLLNGSAVATADWFVLDNPSRAFNYTLLPSTVVSALEVYKSPQADIQEGSLGGTVYLKTRQPLNMDAHTVSLQLQGQYSSTSEAWDPQLSGLYSWKNTEENLGAMISLTKQDRNLQRGGSEVLGWEQQDVGGTDYWIPRAIGDAFFEQERERETLLTSVQWRPSTETEITVNYLNSELAANNQNYNHYIWMKDQLGQGSSIDPSSIVTNGDHIIAADVMVGTNPTTLLPSGPYAEYYVIDRVSFSETEALDVELSYDTDDVIITLKIGTTEAEGGTSSDQQYGFDRTLDGGASFNGFAATGFHGGGVETNDLLLTRGLGYMQENRRIMTDEEQYLGFDFEFPVEVGAFTGFKTGLLYRDHDKAQDTSGTRFHWLTDAMHATGTTVYGAGSQAGWNRWLYGALNAGTLADYAVNGDAPYPLMNLSQAGNAIFPASAYTDYATTDFLFLPETWDVNEKISAVYVKADFEADQLRGNLGLRLVKTEVASTGYSWNGDWVAASIDMIGGYGLLADNVQNANTDNRFDYNVQQVTIDNSYTNVLPNINLAYNLYEDTILRASLARVMARPDYITIANQSSSNVDTGSGSRGNPMLDPEVADQLDLSYEWYFSEEAMITATFFYKDISDSVFNTTSVEPVFDPKTATAVNVTFTEPVNGKGAEVMGLEVSYQQNFGHYGVSANYTFTDAESKDARDAVDNPGSGLVRDVSDHLLNLSGYYENKFMSARLSYNYRTEYYNGISAFGSEYFTDSYGQFDASMSFSLNQEIDLVLEAVNLSNETVEQYHIDQGNPSSRYENGRRFVVGINLNY